MPFEIVPGVTAGVAAPAYAGIPVTHRGTATSVTFVTGHEDPAKAETQTDWSALARSRRDDRALHGREDAAAHRRRRCRRRDVADTPAAAVQWGTYPRQRTVVATLTTLHDAVRARGTGAPVITVIGKVVALRDEIGWFDTAPLFGKRIVVTRATSQAGSRSASGSRRSARR